jgi:hypothetical protein
MSLMGQFVSLTNTLDEDKRQVTRTLIGATLVSQILFEWLWSYCLSQPVVMIQPYLNQEGAPGRLSFLSPDPTANERC